MELKSNDIIIRPLITEKSTALRKAFNKYSFEVNPLSNKSEIGKAVEKMFNVKVLDCHVVTRRGKLKRTRMHAGYRGDTKKAIVTLAKDAKIDFFEGF